ncbi:uncharacterized protein BP01DRAFT_14582 [Aspergillus saccharolyticus JOP 1030-1]|uniref:Uncharacterized protein n=1 Tax=Aspergillus saccharolyticus JOP 1030-1 TaxID=1450539 RepID=A0A319AID3_9EURO|nr:hypothetical protein BP01DRAFT_14582 [Aspergillus saccharolyticus JOP 1030-1]PYH46382.1 hypothetical protein BP01DRAFT_14582 [Aspergillus saccharolyticus JOP 1030-1]
MAYSDYDLTGSAKTLVEEIRDMIQENPVIGDRKPGSGHEFSGKELSSKTAQLEQELSNEKYASRCKVLHLDHGGIIYNRSGHLLVIPLNGSAAFERTTSTQTDEPLRPCHYLTETRKIRGDDIDVILVALEERD